jgi:hypothetical protein
MITLRKTISREKYKLYIPFGIALCYVIFTIFNYLISYADLSIVINLAIMLMGIEIVFIVSRLATEWECIKENMVSIIKISIYIMLLPLVCFLNKVMPALEFDILVVLFSMLALFILTN